MKNNTTLKFVNWNVNGIRAGIKKGFWDRVTELNPDFICLQELKCQDEDLQAIFKDNSVAENIVGNPDNLFANKTEEKLDQKPLQLDASDFLPFWHTCRMKKGYSGTAIFVNKRVLDQENVQILSEFRYFGDDKFDLEGRMMGLEMRIKGELVFLLNGYYPQGGREGRVIYKCEFYQQVYSKVKQMQNEGYKVILCGDLNTTITDIDLARPKENRKTTGCLPEERVALNWLIEPKLFEPEQLLVTNSELSYLNLLDNPSLELIDTFRHFYPDLAGAYSYWDQITRARDRNVGWRIDYWLLDAGLKKNLVSSSIQAEIMGSDHCPVVMELKF